MLKIISCKALKSTYSRRIAYSFSASQFPRYFANVTDNPLLYLERGTPLQCTILINMQLVLDKIIDKQCNA